MGQKITLKGDIYPVDLELTIRAIFEGTTDSSDNVMYFHRKYVEEALPQARKGMVGTFAILGELSRGCAAIAREADEMFRNSDRQTKRTRSAHFSSALSRCSAM